MLMSIDAIELANYDKAYCSLNDALNQLSDSTAVPILNQGIALEKEIDSHKRAMTRSDVSQLAFMTITMKKTCSLLHDCSHVRTPPVLHEPSLPVLPSILIYLKQSPCYLSFFCFKPFNSCINATYATFAISSWIFR